MPLILPLTLAATLVGAAPTPVEPPVELGDVAWTTDLDAAQEVSGETGRPVFMLFQEIPGCKGCRDFGAGALEHPLVVEAIEELFVPVCVNNRGTTERDRALLERFDEPELNYPVARLLDERGEDIIERKDQVFATSALAARMVEALEVHTGEVPAYLELVAQETDEGALKTAHFEMHCYWEGEGHLGAIDGVVGVESGWSGGAEIVTVTYHPDVVTEEALTSIASRHSCKAVRVETERAAQASDQSYTLRRTPYRYLPMTEAQRTKVNAALRLREDPDVYLSGRQSELYERITAALFGNPNALDGVMEMPAFEDWAAQVEALENVLG